MVEVIAYLDDNKEWTKKEIPAEQLTLINYAFANIVGLEIVRDLKKIHLINELKEKSSLKISLRTFKPITLMALI